MSKIVLIGGGTAGHMHPLLALAEQLAKKHGDERIMVITDRRGSDFMRKYSKRFSTLILPILALNLRFWLFGPYIFYISLRFLWNSDTAYFFGGYPSFYPFLATMCLRIERNIYQLDARVTRLNRKLIPFAHRTFYIFPKTDLTKGLKNAFLVPMPICSEFQFSFINHSKNITITVLCGSLGGEYWKKLVIPALKKLPTNKLCNITLKIQTRKSNTAECFDGLNVKQIVTDPFFNVSQILAESHLVISRAGSAIIAEISCVGRPAFLLPLSWAAENHQYFNASQYCEMSGSRFGNIANVDALAEYIEQIIDSEKCFYQLCAGSATSFRCEK
jgi:UDP-N-acetylglucosamine--N-acetylmuramyl-(pentapeptide) pyrophosphoryl-undecaprenol N-acetylglucosamine transferase